MQNWSLYNCFPLFRVLVFPIAQSIVPVENILLRWWNCPFREAKFIKIRIYSMCNRDFFSISLDIEKFGVSSMKNQVIGSRCWMTSMYRKAFEVKSRRLFSQSTWVWIFPWFFLCVKSSNVSSLKVFPQIYRMNRIFIEMTD